MSNEKDFLDKFININESIKNTQTYIKENYHIDSEYDEENNLMYIWSNNVNESLNINAAQEYISEQIGDEFVNVILGQKQ